MPFKLERRSSPIGTMLIVTDKDGALRALNFSDYEVPMRRLLRQHYRGNEHQLADGSAPAAISRALDAYFEGDLAAIAELPVATGGTDFQQAVWRALRAIPAGTTTSYGALAAKLGRAGASRAVGLANGSNPVSIVVPCHRVIGANGTLTGYGGGLQRKSWLLAYEATHAAYRLEG